MLLPDSGFSLHESKYVNATLITVRATIFAANFCADSTILRPCCWPLSGCHRCQHVVCRLMAWTNVFRQTVDRSASQCQIYSATMRSLTLEYGDSGNAKQTLKFLSESLFCATFDWINVLQKHIWNVFVHVFHLVLRPVSFIGKSILAHTHFDCSVHILDNNDNAFNSF